MHFLSRQDREVFEKLVVLANGDARIVWRAFEQNSGYRHTPTLEELIASIDALTGRATPEEPAR